MLNYNANHHHADDNGHNDTNAGRGMRGWSPFQLRAASTVEIPADGRPAGIVDGGYGGSLRRRVQHPRRRVRGVLVPRISRAVQAFCERRQFARLYARQHICLLPASRCLPGIDNGNHDANNYHLANNYHHGVIDDNDKLIQHKH